MLFGHVISLKPLKIWKIVFEHDIKLVKIVFEHDIKLEAFCCVQLFILPFILHGDDISK